MHVEYPDHVLRLRQAQAFGGAYAVGGLFSNERGL